MTDAQRVRSAVMSAVRRGQGEELPERVIELAVKSVGEGLAAGKQWGTLAWELGIARQRLEALWSARAGRQRHGLVRVAVREDPAPAPAAAYPIPPGRCGLALCSPGGWRLEGLSLEEAVQALRVLG